MSTQVKYMSEIRDKNVPVLVRIVNGHLPQAFVFKKFNTLKGVQSNGII